MKPITLPAILLAFFITSMVNAQDVRVGISAGLTMAQLRSKTDNKSENTDWRPGFCAGVLADIIFKAPFGFQTGLNFVQKGGKKSESISGISYDYSSLLNYLELPLNFVYRSKGEKDHFIAGIGPSLAYCLSGKSKFSTGGVTTSEDVKIGTSTSDNIKPFEFGGNLMAGYESSMGIFFTISYNTGFNNLSNDAGDTGKNNYFAVKLGYLFSGKK